MRDREPTVRVAAGVLPSPTREHEGHEKGLGATVGGIAGVVKGVKVKETAFLGIVEDALQQGHWVLVVHARDHQEEERARTLVGETVAPASGA